MAVPEPGLLRLWASMKKDAEWDSNQWQAVWTATEFRENRREFDNLLEKQTVVVHLSDNGFTQRFAPRFDVSLFVHKKRAESLLQ